MSSRMNSSNLSALSRFSKDARIVVSVSPRLSPLKRGSSLLRTQIRFSILTICPPDGDSSGVPSSTRRAGARFVLADALDLVLGLQHLPVGVEARRAPALLDRLDRLPDGAGEVPAAVHAHPGVGLGHSERSLCRLQLSQEGSGPASAVAVASLPEVELLVRDDALLRVALGHVVHAD